MFQAFDGFITLKSGMNLPRICILSSTYNDELLCEYVTDKPCDDLVKIEKEDISKLIDYRGFSIDFMSL